MRLWKLSNRIRPEFYEWIVRKSDGIVFRIFPTPFLLSGPILSHTPGSPFFFFSLSLSFSFFLFSTPFLQLARRQTAINGFFRPLEKTTLIVSSLCGLALVTEKRGASRRRKKKTKSMCRQNKAQRETTQNKYKE